MAKSRNSNAPNSRSRKRNSRAPEKRGSRAPEKRASRAPDPQRSQAPTAVSGKPAEQSQQAQAAKSPPKKSAKTVPILIGLASVVVLALVFWPSRKTEPMGMPDAPPVIAVPKVVATNPLHTAVPVESAPVQEPEKAEKEISVTAVSPAQIEENREPQIAPKAERIAAYKAIAEQKEAKRAEKLRMEQERQSQRRAAREQAKAARAAARKAENERRLAILAARRESTEKQSTLPTFLLENGVNYYIVQPQDNLARIAQKIYGDIRKWLEILRANKGAIADPNMLQIGKKLIIPEK